MAPVSRDFSRGEAYLCVAPDSRAGEALSREGDDRPLRNQVRFNGLIRAGSGQGLLFCSTAAAIARATASSESRNPAMTPN